MARERQLAVELQAPAEGEPLLVEEPQASIHDSRIIQGVSVLGNLFQSLLQTVGRTVRAVGGHGLHHPYCERSTRWSPAKCPHFVLYIFPSILARGVH
jgi:hypothetical protein